MDSEFKWLKASTIRRRVKQLNQLRASFFLFFLFDCFVNVYSEQDSVSGVVHTGLSQELRKKRGCFNTNITYEP